MQKEHPCNVKSIYHQIGHQINPNINSAIRCVFKNMSCKLNETQTKNASWPENNKISKTTMEKKCFSAVSLSYSGSSHVGSLFTNEEQKRLAPDINHLICCQFELLRKQPCWFTLYQRRAEKVGSWHKSFVPFLHMLALFITSLIQTTGHKMAALMDMFLWVLVLLLIFHIFSSFIFHNFNPLYINLEM